MAKEIETARLALLLQLGDSSLILGQRMSEWCGHAPELELDLAASNIALDLIGQANEWLTYAGELLPETKSADELSFLRDAHEFRNVLLVEQPNGDWGQTIARLYLFSAWHVPMLSHLIESSDDRISGIAGKAAREAQYHLRFARDWMMRLGDGTEESHKRMQFALDRLWRFTGELFLGDDDTGGLVRDKIAPLPSSIEGPWTGEVETVLAATGLTAPEVPMMITGARDGHHGEHLGHILCELQYLQRAYPGLEW